MFGRAKNDPRGRAAQPGTGDAQGLRLVHAIAVPNPKEIERRLHRQFAAARAQNEWFEVSVADAKRAIYAMAEYAASIDAQRELDRFIREIGGVGFGLRAYILVSISLFAGLGASVAVAVSISYVWWLITADSIGLLFQILTGAIIGFPAGLSLSGAVDSKIKRIIYAGEIAQRTQCIKKEYEEKFGAKVFLS